MHSPALPLSLSLSFSLFLSLLLSLSLSLSLSFSLSLSLSVSVSLGLPLSLSVGLSLSVWCSRSPSTSHTHSLPRLLSHTTFPSMPLLHDHPGTYVIRSKLTITGNVVLRGASAGRTILHFPRSLRDLEGEKLDNSGGSAYKNSGALLTWAGYVNTGPGVWVANVTQVRKLNAAPAKGFFGVWGGACPPGLCPRLVFSHKRTPWTYHSNNSRPFMPFLAPSNPKPTHPPCSQPPRATPRYPSRTPTASAWETGCASCSTTLPMPA